MSNDVKTDYRLYWIWLAQTAGQASATAVKLVNLFGNAKGVHNAEFSALEAMGNHDLNKRELETSRRILQDKSLDGARRILDEATRLGQRVLVPTDEAYPKNLLILRDAPLVLYVYGKLPNLNRELCISIVGTRTMSDNGRRNAYSIGYGVAAAGAVVVSGMALGADGMALSGAICAGGRTVAVLGGGVDVVYPRDHRELYNNILQKGAVISEYPPGTEPVGFHFPVRNRIISALSAGSVVIEGNMQSGALITARHALYQGKFLFAVPGDIGDPGAAGPNDLLKQGAIVTTGAEDVMCEFEFLYPGCVSMKAMRRALRDRDMDAASAEAMARLRISARGGQNYYGKGSYGSQKYGGVSTSERKKASRVSRRDRRRADESVEIGKASAVLPGDLRETEDVPFDAEPQVTPLDSPAMPADTAGERIELDLLEEINIRVYNLMKPDVPMIPDELVCEGLPINEVLSSLSMLELAGAVESGAGGYFLRRSSEDIELPDEE